MRPHIKTTNFNIIEDNNIIFRGEDPRCFIYKNKLYILDNYLNNMYIIEYESNKFIKLEIGGKNIVFINHNNNLYFIHYMRPLILYKFYIETNTLEKIDVDDDNDNNYEYRGRTPGYKNKNMEYYGFGHRTYYNNNILHL